jgi:VacB/RNase II family 3'-5' exoribonuclease
VNQEYDLSGRAYRALIEAGFHPDFNPAVTQEVSELLQRRSSDLQEARDLRQLHWSSIDNEDSRDLDQVEYAEEKANGRIRLLVGIANVAHYIRTGGPIYLHAAHNTTSVYTGPETFHMLPGALSTDRTSLLEGADRLALVVEMDVQTDGTVEAPLVYAAKIRNQARLSYEEVGDYLQGAAPLATRLNNLPWLGEQLRVQVEASRRLVELRKKAGALTFSSFEPRVVKQDGKVVDLRLEPHTVARELIESFMVAANVGTALFLKRRGWPILERQVTAPRSWDRIREIARDYQQELPKAPDQKALSAFLAQERTRDPVHFQILSLSVVKLLGPGEYVVEYPEGPQQSHFGLAVDDYSHSTAPNRRFADLVLQRLLRANITGKGIPYSPEELQAIAARCNERATKARKVERLMRKVCAAVLMQERIGQCFSAIVTGASPKGTYARLLDFPAEGKITQGERALDVGNQIQVKLLATDPEKGFIDLARV